MSVPHIVFPTPFKTQHHGAKENHSSRITSILICSSETARVGSWPIASVSSAARNVRSSPDHGPYTNLH